jgi:hypothetical protein
MRTYCGMVVRRLAGITDVQSTHFQITHDYFFVGSDASRLRLLS